MLRKSPIPAFAIASILPAGLLVCAMVFGGFWVLAAFLGMAVCTTLLDEALPESLARFDDPDTLRAANRLSVVLGALHFLLLCGGVYVLTNPAGHGLVARFGIFVALGQYLGQVSNPNAHELIHRSQHNLFTLGKWVYISMLFGHHTSAHPKVHHRFVATADDPNTAQKGESAWAFLPRAWWGSFRAGFEIENSDMRRRDGRVKTLRHPYFQYCGGALLFLVLAAFLGGWPGVLLWGALSAYAQMQLLLSDYVQHYGLCRATLPGGKYAPCTSWHSWNTPHWFSSHLMLNAPRHSDHHTHPSRPYPALALDRDSMPMLPRSLPVMASLALFPKLWRRAMHPHLEAWEAAHNANHRLTPPEAAHINQLGPLS